MNGKKKYKGGIPLNHFTKTWMMIVFSFIFIIASGCSTNEGHDGTVESGVTEEAKEDRTKEMYPFPNDTPAGGTSKITLNTVNSTSEDGKVPILYVSKEDAIIQIGMDLENFDKSKQSFVYVDKTYVRKEQFGESAQTSVDLEEAMLKQGIHTVSVVQFDNDDPKDGSVTAYAEADYEVRDGK